MNKKSLVFIITICIVLSIVSLYSLTKPKHAPMSMNLVENVAASYLNSSNIEDYILENQTIHYFIFTDKNSNDCLYVQDNIYNIILDEAKIESIDALQYVEMADATSSQTRTVQKWGIDSYPAFVAIDSTDGNITVTSILAWDYENPYDIDDLRTWLRSHNLYEGIVPLSKSR